MNNYPSYINLTLYSAFYDIMYFYIATWHLMVVSNNSDTTTYTYRNISPVSLKIAVLTSPFKMKTRLRYPSLFVKGLKMFLNVYNFIYQTNIAETFIKPQYNCQYLGLYLVLKTFIGLLNVYKHLRCLLGCL